MNIVKMLFIMIIIIAVISLLIMNMADSKNIFPAWMMKEPYAFLFLMIIFIIIVFTALSMSK